MTGTTYVVIPANSGPRFSTSHHEDSFNPTPDRKAAFLKPAGASLQDTVPDETREELSRRGHTISTTAGPIGNPVMLVIDRANHTAVDVARVMGLAQESGMFGDRARSLAFARAVLESFPEFTGAYFGYEPNADQRDAEFSAAPTIDANALGNGGRFIPYWFRDLDDPNVVRLSPLIDMDTSYYYRGVKNRFERQFRGALDDAFARIDFDQLKRRSGR